MAHNRVITADVEMWSGGGQAGWRVVWYDEETDRCAHWYGNTRAECEARAQSKPPSPR